MGSGNFLNLLLALTPRRNCGRRRPLRSTDNSSREEGKHVNLMVERAHVEPRTPSPLHNTLLEADHDDDKAPDRTSHNFKSGLAFASHSHVFSPKPRDLVEENVEPTIGDQYGDGFFNNSHNFDIQDGTFVFNSKIVHGGDDDLKVLRENMALGARHNSAERFDPPKCHPDTRTAVIDEIMGWMKDSDTSKQVLCMDGPAGCGKSAIEQTLAEICEGEGILAASFFFSTSSPQRNHKSSFIATLAYQIATSIKDLRPFIARAIMQDLCIIDQSLETQLVRLLVEPIRKAVKVGKRTAWPHVIIIDGLDECQGPENQAHVLRVIHLAAVTYGLPFRIVLASRPEYAFRTAMEGDFCDAARRLTLDDSYNPDKDIDLFLKSKFAAIRRRNKHLANLPSWPLGGDIETIVNKSSGQSIYAATVVKFVDEYRHNPARRLQMVLNWTSVSNSSTNPFKELDNLYSNILAFSQHGIDRDSDISLVQFVRKILLVDAYFPAGISLDFVDDFFLLETGDTSGYLSDLYSLLSIPCESGALGIRPYHKSLTEYLEDPSRCREGYIGLDEIYRDLAVLSLKCLKRSNATDTNQQEFSSYVRGPVPLEYAAASWIRLSSEAVLDIKLRNELLRLDYMDCAKILKQLRLRINFLPNALGSLTPATLCQRIREEHPDSTHWLWICTRMEIIVAPALISPLT